MRELLLDYRRFQTVWGEETKSFLYRSVHGLQTRLQQGDATSSHVDHTLASLAEVGTPLDYPVITADGETNLGELLNHTLKDFSLNQIEYEWSTLVYALYLAPELGPRREWITTEGQRISFDRLASRIMRQELRQGVCYGNHRLHALVMLLRVDEQHPILSEAARRKIVQYLQDVTRKLVANQNEKGYWNPNWDGTVDDFPEDGKPLLSGRVLATGHAMEWWALAPKEILPPDEVLVKAGQWLCHEIEKMSDRQITTSYTFLSHAGRALSLWRGKFPAEVHLHQPASSD